MLVGYIFSGFRQTGFRLFWGVVIALTVVGFSFSDVKAAGAHEAKVTYMTGNGALKLSPGERIDVMVEFQNTGSATWYNDGAGYISLYTHGPKYRRSVFDPGTWIWGDQVKRIREAAVSPGGTGSMIFELKAPEESGYYEEVFHLASEDTAWIDGGQVTLHIEVGDSVAISEASVTEGQADDAAGLNAELAVTSAKEVKASALRSILFTAAFRNTGSKTWTSYGLNVPDVSIAAQSAHFNHPSWDGTRVAYTTGQSVPPGELAVVTFAFTAPAENGSHTTSFQFEANGQDVPGAVVQIPVEVTDGTAAVPVTTDPPAVEVIEENDDGVIDTGIYIDEPMIRVGVLIVDEETENEVQITSLESDFDVIDINGNLLAEIEAGKVVTAYYQNGKYYFDRGNGPEVSSYGLRFDTKTDHAVLRIVNWDKRITRGSAYADNEFRNVLEFRHNDYKERAWIINELGLDYYLRGLAETNDGDEEAYNKAQLIAARSYAYYHMTHGGKRASEFMDLNSTPSDQYYLGYGREKRAPSIAELADETSGMIVTYGGDVAITPYYARSNGSTKNWSAVWWGDQPHAKAVTVPCDIGKVQWGHGVGMPQSGAACLAEEGKSMVEILKYFYTGVEIEKRWK